VNRADYDSDWWRRIFDETYLVTDARSVCCPQTTAAEVDMVLANLELHPDDRILDLCGGQGRHALELGRRGYDGVTVVDYSEFLLRVGLEDANKAGCAVSFCRADACEVGLADGIFDAVLVMGNSFGYFAEDIHNQKILVETHRLLKSGGTLLLDLIHNEYARRQLRPSSWHEAGENVVVCRQRKLCDDGILVREVVLNKQHGLVRDLTYFARLFRFDELETLLKASGFKQIKCATTFSSHPRADDYGLLGKRMLITARKP
jgi:D-alanine-D-alanine ligase